MCPAIFTQGYTPKNSELKADENGENGRDGKKEKGQRN